MYAKKKNHPRYIWIEDALDIRFSSMIYVGATFFNRWLQDVLVQATYWHDPLNEKMYREGSTFLADINNERYLNHSYIKNLKALENMIFVKFERDSMVQPVESEWFGFYKPGQAKEVETLQESDLYINVRIPKYGWKGDMAIKLCFRIVWVWKRWTKRENCIFSPNQATI